MMAENRNKWMTLVGLLLVVVIAYTGLHTLLSKAPFATSSYNSYTLQAMAWRDGKLSLGRDYPHLELAIYQDDWYVSFPPVPSLVQWALTFPYGMNTPDGFVVKLYPLLACLAICLALKKAGLPPLKSAIWALLLIYGSCIWHITLDGGVWYLAQTLGLALSVGAVAAIYFGHPIWSCAMYALSVGCRPFNVLLGPVLLAIYWMRCKKEGQSFKMGFKKLLPGLCVGLSIAAAYAIYNYMRFGNPLEFGHTYLPEFQRSQTGQFNIQHVFTNAKRFFLSLPFFTSGQGLEAEKFGFSMFLANPAFILLFAWLIEDGIKKRLTAAQGMAVGCFILQLFCLLLHRTFGGYQFGARYTLDLLPYCFAYRLCAKQQRGVRWYEAILLALGTGLNLYGAYLLG